MSRSISQAEAKEALLSFTVSSLRKLMDRDKMLSEVVGKGCTDKDVAKVKKEIERLITKLNRGRPSEPEARAPSADEGKDHISEVPDGTKGRDPATTVGKYKPEARKREEADHEGPLGRDGHVSAGAGGAGDVP